MAPNISPGAAATALAFLVLAGLQLETRMRVGEVLAAPPPQFSEPAPEPLAHHLQGEMQLKGTVADVRASVAGSPVRVRHDA